MYILRVIITGMVVKLLKEEERLKMLRSFFMFSLVLLTSCIASTGQQHSFEEIRDNAVWDKVSQSMVEIENYRFSTYIGYNVLYCTGSGYVWGDDNHIITNAHVCKYAASIKVVLKSGENVQLRLLV